MRARIIASAAEIGPFETLTFYGQALTREWSGPLTVGPDVERKLRGNRYLEVKDVGAPVPVPAAPPPISSDQQNNHRAGLIAELKALEVVFAKNAKTETLEALLAEAKGQPVPVPADDDPRRAELIAQLRGLEVEFDENADTEVLESALDAATAP